MSENLLMMDGVDHIEIEPKLPWILDTISRGIPNVETRHCRLEEYIDAQRPYASDCEIINGELYNVARRGINNQLLKNVLSSMVRLKQLNDETERSITKWAEPFDAFASLSGGADDTSFLAAAWDFLLQNHPHDSICGCSISEVHEDNEYRFKQALEISEDIFAESANHLSVNPALENGDTIVVFNGSPRDFTGTVLAQAELPVGTIPNLRIYSSEGAAIDCQIINITRDTWRKKHTFRQLAKYQTVDAYTVAFQATVPSFGYAGFRYTNLPTKGPSQGDYSYANFHPPVRNFGSTKTGESMWENSFFSMRINGDGSLSVRDRETGREYPGMHRFEDRADVGDGWNWRPAPVDTVISSKGAPVSIGFGDRGISKSRRYGGIRRCVLNWPF